MQSRSCSAPAGKPSDFWTSCVVGGAVELAHLAQVDGAAVGLDHRRRQPRQAAVVRLGAQRGREDEEADAPRGPAGLGSCVVQELLLSLPPCGRRLRPIRHTFAMAGPEHSPGERPERDRSAAPPPHRRAHTSARDLERYAGLFAARTQVMRSSAMRDLMAITARPEVISLAGGLPDTASFPPDTFAAQMTKIAQESSAEALQYGPTEGFERTKRVHRRGDGGRGDGSRLRRHHRHDRRPAGDRPRHQDARRPRRRR